MRRQETIELPAQRNQIRRILDHVAQRVDIGLGGIGADLQQQIAVAEFWDRARRWKICSMDTRCRGFNAASPEPVVEQRGADRDRDGEIVGIDTAGPAGPNPAAAFLDRAPVSAPPWSTPRSALSECATAVQGPRGRFASTSNGGDHRRGRLRRNHAGLSLAVERLAIEGAVAFLVRLAIRGNRFAPEPRR